MNDRARHKANFCLATGVQPSEYDRLYVHEVEAFVKEHQKQNRK